LCVQFIELKLLFTSEILNAVSRPILYTIRIRQLFIFGQIAIIIYLVQP